MAPRPSIGDQCPICDNLLGDLEPGKTKHRFCEWATWRDWAALLPYMDGTFRGVQAGGG